MAFKYNSLGTGKSLADVAANSLAKVLGPKGKIPANAADAKRAENATAQRNKDSKQSVADAAGRAPVRPSPRPPGRPGGGRP